MNCFFILSNFGEHDKTQLLEKFNKRSVHRAPSKLYGGSEPYVQIFFKCVFKNLFLKTREIIKYKYAFFCFSVALALSYYPNVKLIIIIIIIINEQDKPISIMNYCYQRGPVKFKKI